MFKYDLDNVDVIDVNKFDSNIVCNSVGGEAILYTELIRGAFSSLNEVIKASKEYEIAKEQEYTKRNAIRAQKEIALESIRQNSKNIERIIDKHYDQSLYSINEMLKRLDKGIEEGNQHLIALSLDGIVKTVQCNPLSHFQSFDKEMREKPLLLDL